jgi:hypothetical protein
LKNLLSICAILMLLVFTGCPGSQTATGMAPSTGVAYTTNADDSKSTPDAAAAGGSSLTASAPYKSAGATAQQNVNPTPFMVATQPAGKAFTPTSELISRADGTMMGPKDQMAAGTGPAGQGMSDMVPRKPAPAVKPAPKK